MLSAILASTALLASIAHAQGAVGTAYVQNNCDYDVILQNTPAAGGGYETIDRTLKAGTQYSQAWTELSNAQGWSIKLSRNEAMSNILQYEYTFHNDGTIWYDLSAVNGNPWDKNFEISATGADCTPRQAAYQYSTDDAYGMQACPQAADITVTICSASGGSGSTGSGSSAAPAASPETSAADTSVAATSAAYTSEAAPTSTAAPVSSAESSTNTFQFGHNTWSFAGKQVADAPTTQATTFATAVSSAPSESHPPGVTVTQIATQVVTNYVTATAEAPAKRHEHHRRHPHQRL